MITPSNLYDEILVTIWFLIYKVHDHLLTVFWVKPHTVFYTKIMYISNSKIQ